MEKPIQKHAASLIGSANTPAAELRLVLKELEIKLGKMQTSSDEELSAIPFLFDKAAELLDILEINGANITSEYGRFDTICATYRHKSQRFLKALGGQPALVQLRKPVNPAPEKWWWFIDEYIAEQTRFRNKKQFRSFIIFAAISGLLILVYAIFLAPDKATRERFRLEGEADQAIANGLPEQALIYLEQALEIDPDNASLLIEYGVIAQLNEKFDIAESSFNRAKALINNEEDYLTSRSQIYLQTGLPELALEDAEDAIAINPESAFAHYQKGVSANALGDRQTAFIAMEKAANFADQEGKIELEAMARIQMAYLTSGF
ncbi:MAG: hypothetical protein P1S60_06450 [Anaerolineae bacterium]|nr:hypothetical protein [Anaerolineae bacterium]